MSRHASGGGTSWPMPSISTSRAPGIARARARPWAGGKSGSSRAVQHERRARPASSRRRWVVGSPSSSTSWLVRLAATSLLRSTTRSARVRRRCSSSVSRAQRRGGTSRRGARRPLAIVPVGLGALAGEGLAQPRRDARQLLVAALDRAWWPSVSASARDRDGRAARRWARAPPIETPTTCARAMCSASRIADRVGRRGRRPCSRGRRARRSSSAPCRGGRSARRGGRRRPARHTARRPTSPWTRPTRR